MAGQKRPPGEPTVSAVFPKSSREAVGHEYRRNPFRILESELGQNAQLERIAVVSAPRTRSMLAHRDCMAGMEGFELRNVVANYPFERSHRFVGIQPNFWPQRLFAFELRRWRYAARA